MTARASGFLGILAVLGVAAALLAWRIAHVNFVLYEDTGRPRLMRAAAPQGAGSDAAEVRMLRAVLDENPAEVAALLVLARHFEASQQPGPAARAYTAALAIAPVEQPVLAAAALHALRQGDALGVELLGRLLDIHPDARHRAYGVLTEALLSQSFGHAVAAMLARNPSWAGSYLAQACAAGVEPAALVPALLARRSAAGSAAEGACVVERLRAAGRWDQAYHLWLNLLPRERLGYVGFVFNGSFEDVPLGSAFDWTFDRRPERHSGHSAQIVPAEGVQGRRALRVAYTGGRQHSPAASQYLALVPGNYEMSGLVRTDTLRAPRGVRWTLRCMDGAAPGPAIAHSEPFQGASPWRRFSASVRVEPSCRGQLLQLEAASDGAVAFVGGAVWFDDLRLARR